MTEIQVLIPLSVFGDAKDLTPQAISEAISNVDGLKMSVAKLTARNEQLIKTIQNLGLKLEEIRDSGQNEMNKAQALRNMIQDLKDFQG